MEKRAQEIRNALNEASAKLTAAILQFEAELADAKLGVRGVIDIAHPTIKIGYMKVSGKWRFTVSAGPGEPMVPVAEAERGLRLYAYRHRALVLPALLKIAESLTRRMYAALDAPTDPAEHELPPPDDTILVPGWCPVGQHRFDAHGVCENPTCGARQCTPHPETSSGR